MGTQCKCWFAQVTWVEVPWRSASVDILTAGKSSNFLGTNGLGFIQNYPPVNKHSNGKSPSWIGNTSSNGGFSIAMLDYRSVCWKTSFTLPSSVQKAFHRLRSRPATIAIGLGIILYGDIRARCCLGIKTSPVAGRCLLEAPNFTLLIPQGG